MNNQQEINQLENWIDANMMGDAVVAFSGGVDSSLLLKIVDNVAKKKMKKVYAITVTTQWQPKKETEDSTIIAREFGVEHIILDVDISEYADIWKNPINRCYQCKKILFENLKKKAEMLGADTIFEGTNMDDHNTYRPGIKAIEELGILSPLFEIGLTKEKVRKLAFELGISVSNKPSAPCLATRFAYGEQLTEEKMKQVEDGELYLKSLGFYNVRLRVYKETVRIEVDLSELKTILLKRKEIVDKLKELGFVYINLDLEGFRSGSMDIGLNKK